MKRLAITATALLLVGCTAAASPVDVVRVPGLAEAACLELVSEQALSTPGTSWSGGLVGPDCVVTKDGVR